MPPTSLEGDREERAIPRQSLGASAARSRFSFSLPLSFVVVFTISECVVINISDPHLQRIHLISSLYRTSSSNFVWSICSIRSSTIQTSFFLSTLIARQQFSSYFTSGANDFQRSTIVKRFILKLSLFACFSSLLLFATRTIDGACWSNERSEMQMRFDCIV